MRDMDTVKLNNMYYDWYERIKKSDGTNVQIYQQHLNLQVKSTAYIEYKHKEPTLEDKITAINQYLAIVQRLNAIIEQPNSLDSKESNLEYFTVTENNRKKHVCGIRVSDTYGSYELFFILRKMGFGTYEVDKKLTGSFMEPSSSNLNRCSEIEMRSTRTSIELMDLFVVIGELH